MKLSTCVSPRYIFYDFEEKEFLYGKCADMVFSVDNVVDCSISFNIVNLDSLATIKSVKKILPSNFVSISNKSVELSTKLNSGIFVEETISDSFSIYSKELRYLNNEETKFITCIEIELTL